MKTLDIRLSDIKPNQHQPRTEFATDTIFELANSIKENGLIQPIVVREVDSGYEIIAGERRFRATELLGEEKIRAFVVEASADESAHLALIENIQREDLSAIEEAKAYKKLLAGKQWTQEDLAKRLGKSQSSIANKLRLLNLDFRVQNAVSGKEISERHARALIGLEPDQQNLVLKAIFDKNMNVRETEAYVEKVNSKPKKKIQFRGFSKNVKIALNTIKQALSSLKKAGFNFMYTEDDNPEEVVITIRIKK